MIHKENSGWSFLKQKPRIVVFMKPKYLTGT